jgi:hypothetical protein
MRGPFLFLCKKLSEFRFRRKANEIRNRGAGGSDKSFGAHSPSLSLQAPLASSGPRSAASAFLLFERSDPKSLTRNSQ